MLTNFSKARWQIGYCPQHDALFPTMTVSEHLWFYAKIKGIPSEQRQKVIEKVVNKLDLDNVLEKPSGQLSGGNQRKLSVGIAILGSPPVVLLDEPSSGMDPEARRFMWTLIERISQQNKHSAIVLTTHSMEEAEALSTKMGIMTHGGIMRCYGSAQHIKNKFGTGFELEVNIRKPSYSELSEFAAALGLNGDLSKRVSLENELDTLTRRNTVSGTILAQLSQYGLGADLVQQAEANESGLIRMTALAQFCFTMVNGFKLMEALCLDFASVELLEHCGQHFKLRVPRQDKTIGWLFGRIEALKSELNVQEYGVSQTSLE